MNHDWMQVTVEVPDHDGLKLLAYLRGELNFVEIDFCELQRPDRARATYAPSEPRTSSGYTVEPFPDEHPDGT
ncbi:MAG: hypothetical protein ABWY93_18745 [Mycobacterium sp.]